MVKVLIVDENALICHQIRENLNINYEIYFAHNCEDALTICKATPIDIILVTLALPSNKLMEMLTQLRDNFPETRVIGMSEHMCSSVQINAMLRIGSLGVDQVLSQPIATQELHDAVDKELGSAICMV